jgi:methionine synthase II (cobalamin-independent)
MTSLLFTLASFSPADDRDPRGSRADRGRDASDIARAIERTAKLLGKGRIKYIHPDCGFWMLQRNMADGKMRALVAGRDLYEGRKA